MSFFQRSPSGHQRPAKPTKQTVPNRHRALPHRKQRRRRLLVTFLVAIAPIRQGPASARSRARLVRSPQSRSTTEIVTSRYRSHTPFGIGAEQLLGVGELGPSPPTEQAVDREISLNVVDKEQYRKVSDWFDAHAHQKILFLELGVELRNGVIKRMLAQIANACEHITYTAFNYSQAMAPDTSCETILVDGDMAPAFAREPRATRALCCASAATAACCCWSSAWAK